MSMLCPAELPEGSKDNLQSPKHKFSVSKAWDRHSITKHRLVSEPTEELTVSVFASEQGLLPMYLYQGLGVNTNYEW